MRIQNASALFSFHFGCRSQSLLHHLRQDSSYGTNPLSLTRKIQFSPCLHDTLDALLPVDLYVTYETTRSWHLETGFVYALSPQRWALQCEPENNFNLKTGNPFHKTTETWNYSLFSANPSPIWREQPCSRSLSFSALKSLRTVLRQGTLTPSEAIVHLGAHSNLP